MKFKNTKILTQNELKQVFELWNNEYPKNLVYPNQAEFTTYLNELKDVSHILLIDSNKKISGWYFNFIRDDEKWFGILLNSEIQGKGFGTELLYRAKQKESELNGWVIEHNDYLKQDGQSYKSPLNFYLKNDFKKLNEERLELDHISAVKIQWKK